MLLMSVCENNIIANSSFSWFGAYFNQNENKRVCYPSVWFGPTMKKDLRDLFFIYSKKQAMTQGAYAMAKILFKCPAFTKPKL